MNLLLGLLGTALFVTILGIKYRIFNFQWPDNHPDDPMPSTDNTTDIPLEAPKPAPIESNREKLYKTSYACIGRKMSVDHSVSDYFACVVSFRGVCKEAFGFDPAPGAQNTNQLNGIVATDTLNWKEITEDELQPGDLQIALTQGEVHGHILVRGKQDSMSNDSSSGLWRANYRNANVQLVFKKTLGLKIKYYRAVDN